MLHQNINSMPFLAPTMPQINDLSPVQVVGDIEGKKEPKKAVDNLAYTYAFLALTPLADWLEAEGRHFRVGDRRCWSLDEVVRAVEAGEWGG